MLYCCYICNNSNDKWGWSKIKEYITSIATMAIISALIQLLLPENSGFKKYVTLATSLILVVIILKPIVDITKTNIPEITLPKATYEDKTAYDETKYNNLVTSTFVNRLETQINNYISTTYNQKSKTTMKVTTDEAGKPTGIEKITIHTSANALLITKYVAQKYEIPIEKVVILNE